MLETNRQTIELIVVRTLQAYRNGMRSVEFQLNRESPIFPQEIEQALCVLGRREIQASFRKYTERFKDGGKGKQFWVIEMK